MAKLSPTDMIAICAVFISVVALGSSIWQGIITRRHNMLSVRPRVDLTFSIDKSKPFRIIIKNTGLGLAIIEHISATLCRKTYYLNSKESLDSLFEDLIGDNFELKGKYSYLSQNVGIPPNSEIIFVSLQPVNDQAMFWSLIEKNLKNLHIEISYKCLYENHYTSYFGIDQESS